MLQNKIDHATKENSLQQKKTIKQPYRIASKKLLSIKLNQTLY